MENKKEAESIVNRAKKFLKETESEARKVIWPDRKYTAAATVIVLIIVFLCAIYVLAIDFGFGKLFEALNLIFKPGI